jgi:transcriptional regulator with XRE-family HTH domain
MSKPTDRAYSTYSREAVALIGQIIRLGRTERKISAGELAARAGISRDLLQRIERGNPGSAIGAVFEAAAIVGVKLFETGPQNITEQLAAAKAKLALLPRKARKTRKAVKDAF